MPSPAKTSDLVFDREESLEAFLVRIRSRLTRVLRSYGIPPEDVEDLLHQSVLALLPRWAAIRDPDAWLLGTIRNNCLMYWRTKGRQLYESVDRDKLEGMAKPEHPHQERGDQERDIDTLLSNLTPRCRKILEMRFRQGLDGPEIARRLSYKPSSIGKLCSRCLDCLAREMMLRGWER